MPALVAVGVLMVRVGGVVGFVLLLVVLVLLLLPGGGQLDVGEVVREQGVDLGVPVHHCRSRRPPRRYRAAAEGDGDWECRGGEGAQRGHAEAAHGGVVVLALVLLVAHDGLAGDLEAAAGALLAAFRGFEGGAHAVLDVAVGAARGGYVGAFLVFFVSALGLGGVSGGVVVGDGGCGCFGRPRSVVGAGCLGRVRQLERGRTFFRGTSPTSLASERGERRFMGMAGSLVGVCCGSVSLCVCVDSDPGKVLTARC